MGYNCEQIDAALEPEAFDIRYGKLREPLKAIPYGGSFNLSVEADSGESSRFEESIARRGRES